MVRWRVAARTAAGLLLLAPLPAMQVTEEVVWSAGDFLFAGILLGSVGAAYELTVRKTGNRAYRAAMGVALAAAFLLVWVNASVGVIGAAGNGANAMYGGVLGVGVLGSLLARFRPQGMAWALVATALAQMAVAGIAVAAGWGETASSPAALLAVNGGFAGLWLLSAALFHRASRGVSGAV